MRTIAAVLLITAVAFAGQLFGQTTPSASPSQKAAPTSPRKPARSAQGAPDLGSVSQDVYSESFFNLKYAVPQGWTIRTDEMRQAAPAGSNGVLLLSAFAHAQPEAGQVNSSVTITAEPAAEYQGNIEAYLEELTGIAQTRGFKILNQPAELELGGVTFVREDLVKEDPEGSTYQASMITERKGYLLTITVITGDDEQLTPLLNRLQIFAPPSMRR